jgi:hypothetical protein
MFKRISIAILPVILMGASAPAGCELEEPTTDSGSVESTDYGVVEIRSFGRSCTPAATDSHEVPTPGVIENVIVVGVGEDADGTYTVSMPWNNWFQIYGTGSSTIEIVCPDNSSGVEFNSFVAYVAVE